MKIHPVISIAQLEPATPGSDPYERGGNRDPPPVFEAGSKAPSYEIERLLDKRVARGHAYCLVKWKDYGNKHIVWYPLRALGNVEDIVREYEATTAVQRHVRVRVPRRRATTKTRHQGPGLTEPEMEAPSTTTVTPYHGPGPTVSTVEEPSTTTVTPYRGPGPTASTVEEPSTTTVTPYRVQPLLLSNHRRPLPKL
jgi:hypothetical protein